MNTIKKRLEDNKEICCVSGSHGFVGSRLIKYLEGMGYQVLRGDRYGTVPKGTSFYYDCASYGNRWGQNDQLEILIANVHRVRDLLNHATKCKAIVLTSSSSVTLPVKTAYARAKMDMERIAIKQSRKLPIVVLRPSSVTGPGEQDMHLIPCLIESCLVGKKMPFVPDPTHDFVDVRDVARAYLLLAKEIDKCRGQVFQVSNNKAWTNEEVKNMVEKIMKRKANLEIVESLRPYDNPNWKVDNSKLLALGWKPTISLEKSIQHMVLLKCGQKDMSNMQKGV